LAVNIGIRVLEGKPRRPDQRDQGDQNRQKNDDPSGGRRALAGAVPDWAQIRLAVHHAVLPILLLNLLTGDHTVQSASLVPKD